MSSENLIIKPFSPSSNVFSVKMNLEDAVMVAESALQIPRATSRKPLTVAVVVRFLVRKFKKGEARLCFRVTAAINYANPFRTYKPDNGLLTYVVIRIYAGNFPTVLTSLSAANKSLLDGGPLPNTYGRHVCRYIVTPDLQEHSDQTYR